MDDRHDLTTGPIGKKLFIFALPIFAAELLQAVYNLVDMIIVGQFIGSAGMSAVGISGQVIHLVFSACNAFAHSASAFVGQYYGAGKKEQVQKVVGTTLTFLIIAALTITAAIFLLIHPLLRGLNTPAECYRETLVYMLIYTSGTVFVYSYTALNSALRGIGESFHPMLYVIITTVENILLDLLFVAVLPWGTAGAALATVISQATSMVLVIWYTKRHSDIFDFRLRSFRIRMDILRPLVHLGLPQIIQYVATNLSFVLITSLVNRFGVNAAAAAGAANKIWTFGVLPGRAIDAALIPMTAQCHPQRKYKRVIKGLLYGTVFAVSLAALLTLFCLIRPGVIYGVFTSDPGVRETGVGYLRILSVSFLIEAVWFSMVGVLIGSGYTRVSMVCSLVSAFAVRLLLAWLLSTLTSLGFVGIAVAYLVAPFFAVGIGGYYIVTGRWKQSRIQLAD